jgi:hypothetical protein
MDRDGETEDGAIASREAAYGAELDARATLARLRAVIYDWDIASDRLIWGANASETLAGFSPAALASGASYAELVSAESLSSRFQAIQAAATEDAGEGAPYRTLYRLKGPDGADFAVEDFGRCYADARVRCARTASYDFWPRMTPRCLRSAADRIGAPSIARSKPGSPPRARARTPSRC